jgi:Mrp family chromosome partitioning ATPase
VSQNFELLQSIEHDSEIPRSDTRETGALNATIPVSDSALREELLKLVYRIFLLRPRSDPGGLSVLFTGIDSGSGSSSICALGAKTLAAETAGTICVVDANLRSPSLDVAFGVENVTKLPSVSRDALGSIARCVGEENLFLVTSAALSEGAGQELTSEGLNIALANLRSKFDYILINAAPLALNADTVLLGKMADGVVLVVEAHTTRRESALKAKFSLESAGIPILGSVLNGRTFPIPQFIYDRL